MHFTRIYSICTSATKDVYIHPLTVSRVTKIFSCQQPRTYILPSFTPPAASDAYIHPHKGLFIDVWLLDVYFFWLLSCI